MTILVDNPATWDNRFPNYCHMWSDTMDVDELNAFAARLGLKRSWLQCSTISTGKFWHYDISLHKRQLALRLGAQFMSAMDWIKQERAKGDVAPDVKK